MSTLTDDRDSAERPKPVVLRNEEMTGMTRCSRCNLSYSTSKSTSALRLTYCSFLCELGDLGFSIVGLEHMVLKPREIVIAPETLETPEPVATP
jgi:hypothetical protein